MASVGLVVNPSASGDVRRLTSLARTVDVHERANTVARVLCGLAGGDVETVLYMPEPAHVVDRARDALLATPAAAVATMVRLRPVALAGDGYARDAAGTSAATAAMAEAGVACIVTLGGDGTNRAVVAGWPAGVLVPLPGGTNNAFATAVDPTAAGLAAALYALDPVPHGRHVARRSLLDIRLDGAAPTMALVDVALVRGGWVGAHAIWDPDLLLEAVVARSDPSLTGLAGVAGAVRPIDAGAAEAIHIRFGAPGRRVLAPLGPGQLVPVEIHDWRVFGPDEPVDVPGPRGDGVGLVTLAFDGERETVLEPGAVVAIRLVRDGPGVLDVVALLRAAAAEGRLVMPRGSGAAA
jgi:ATP-NAD kinase N-terminal domain